MGIGHPSDRLLEALLETRGPIVRESLGGRTRHQVQRIGADRHSWVLKTYRSVVDEYFLHRFRREERILRLLANSAPGLAPTVNSGVVGTDEAFLVMEDLGKEAESLHRVLSGPGDRIEPLAGAVAALARWHAVAGDLHELLSAFCRSIVLDRNDRATLVRRHLLALRRVGAGLSEPNARSFASRVIDPLLERPQRVIHNSANALNFVVRTDGSVALIDFETISLGPLEFDLAELAIHPALFARHGLAGTAALYRGDVDPDTLARAGLLRAIDASGALARQARRAPDAGTAGDLDRRAGQYRGVANQIAEELGVDDCGLPAA
jgi:aminoglycoside phosphotransferase (APT) family kinase protein